MLFLAIDIGGSKSQMTVFDEQKSIVEVFSSPGVGFAVDSREDLPEFSAVLSAIDEKYEICSVAVNLGGKNIGQVQRAVTTVFPNIPVDVFRESGGKASLAFGKICGADIIILAGTGCIAAAVDSQGNGIICGGWGANISDAGSGYDIGLNAIKSSLRALDGIKPLTPMQQEITGCQVPFSVTDDLSDICDYRDRVRGLIYPFDRKKIASYAKIAAKYADLDDEDAQQLFYAAGEKLGRLAVCCADKLSPYKAGKVAVSGGLVNSSHLWMESFETTVRNNSTVHSFVYEKDGVSLGTMELAVQLIKNRNT